MTDSAFVAVYWAIFVYIVAGVTVFYLIRREWCRKKQSIILEATYGLRNQLTERDAKIQRLEREATILEGRHQALERLMNEHEKQQVYAYLLGAKGEFSEQDASNNLNIPLEKIEQYLKHLQTEGKIEPAPELPPHEPPTVRLIPIPDTPHPRFATKFCPKCGKSNTLEDAQFCVECGATLK